MNRVDDKIALVTGAARGIGRRAAKCLAEAGATVVVTDIDEAGAANTAGGIETTGGKALSLLHDVTSEEDWGRVVGETESRYGRLDILVNNAGIFFYKSIEDTSLDDWRRITRVNLDGVFLGTKYAIEAMKKNGPAGGSIINMSSAYGMIGEAINAAYCASKGAVMNFTKSAALHCGKSGYNIRVNSVHPGVVRTPMTEVEIDEIVAAQGYDSVEEAVEKEWVPAHPIGRIGEPIDISNGVVYLASDESSFMTGAELVIDGGMTAQ